MSESEFLETLNSSIKYLDVEYYFAAGIERQVFAPFWDIANQFASIDLSQIVNDGVVERSSALGSGLRFQQYRLYLKRLSLPSIIPVLCQMRLFYSRFGTGCINLVSIFSIARKLQLT